MSNENQPESEDHPVGGDPPSPQSQAKAANAKLAPTVFTRDPSPSNESQRSLDRNPDAMAYSAPNRYAGVLAALELLRVDLETAPLPGLIALIRSTDPDLADRATAERWDRDRLIVTMRDEAHHRHPN